MSETSSSLLQITPDLHLSVIIQKRSLLPEGSPYVPKPAQNDPPSQEDDFCLSDDSQEKSNIGFQAPQLRTEFHITLNPVETGHPGLVLHWALSTTPDYAWNAPKKSIWPNGTKAFDPKAVQTPFTAAQEEKEQKILIGFSDLQEEVFSMNFVLFDSAKNIWYNNGGKDYHLRFKESVVLNSGQLPDSPDQYTKNKISEVIRDESNFGRSMTLMHRYHKCKEILNGTSEPTTQLTSWIFMWLRLSALRELDWQRNYNTQPRELGHAIQQLTKTIAHKYNQSKGKKAGDGGELVGPASWIKMSMGCIGMGKGNAQEIRDGILKILHRFKIKQVPGRFYEQWHQKLHNNTTYDDVGICEAVIEFLKSGGNSKVYWDVLAKYKITKQRLENFDRNITSEPYYVDDPALIQAFKDYGAVIKSVHSGDDLGETYNHAKGQLDGSARDLMEEVWANFHDWDTLKQIARVTGLREKISVGSVELIFFDNALESYVRQLTQKIMHVALEPKHLLNEIHEILRNLMISYPSKELKIILTSWGKLVMPVKESLFSNKEQALLAKSVSDRLQRYLGEIVDTFQAALQKKAEYMGKKCNCDENALVAFTEEVLRGTLFFSASMVLKKIELPLRKAANLPDWITISPGNKIGRVVFQKTIREVQFQVYKEPTILITRQIDGDEEVPEGAVGVLLVNAVAYPDILAHVSVRARNNKAVFAVCLDGSRGAQLIDDLVGKWAKIETKSREVVLELSEKKSSDQGFEKPVAKHLEVKMPAGSDSLFINLKEFAPGATGAKSKNTKILAEKEIADWVYFPKSGAVPFQSCEKLLREQNPLTSKKISKLLEILEKTTSRKKILKILDKCGSLVQGMGIDGDRLAELVKGFQNFGISQPEKALDTLKQVWASKFNERVWAACRKQGFSLPDVSLSVLVQEVVLAKYAFVIHTVNPATMDADQVYCEVVVGLGETLVGGDFPGQAFSFTYNKKTSKCEILSYPNKSEVMWVGEAKGFIFRSDSNAEDLPGFAGAGLFDSIPVVENIKERFDYSEDILVKGGKERDELMQGIGKIGVLVEAAYSGEAQDIEGVVDVNGKLYVVQTRPQV